MSSRSCIALSHDTASRPLLQIRREKTPRSKDLSRRHFSTKPGVAESGAGCCGRRMAFSGVVTLAASLWRLMRIAGDVGNLWIVIWREYTKWRRGSLVCPVARVISAGRLDFGGLRRRPAIHRLYTIAICEVHNLCTRKKKRAQPLCPATPRSSGKECCRNLDCVAAVCRNNSTQ